MLDEQRPYLDEAWLYLEYVIRGRTLRDIAKPYDVTYQRIGQMVKLFRLTEKRNALRKPYMNKEWLSGEFVDKRRTQQSIADGCSVYRDTITTWVARHNLKRKFYMKKELTQRNVARQNRLYATDPEYRKTKLANSARWKEQNPERWKKYLQEYNKKRQKKKGGERMTDTNQMKAIIAKPESSRADGIVYTADALRKLANGKTIFWNEECKQLEYRGPYPRKMIIDRNQERGRAKLSLSGDCIYVHPADAAEMEIILRDLNFPAEHFGTFSFSTLGKLDVFAEAVGKVMDGE